MKKIFILILALIMCVPTFAGCSRPPELSEVKDEFIAILEKSYEVNDVIFGDGLVTDYDLSGKYAEYTEEMKNAETFFVEETMYYQLYDRVVPSYMKDTDGDGVGDTLVKQPQTIDEIKKLISSVYSSNLSSKLYVQMFESHTVTVNGSTETLRPHYRDGYVEEGSDTEKDGVLRKYIFLKENGMNYISSRGGRTVYDYDTMKIVKPSDGDTVVVEIKGLYQDYSANVENGNYDDWESVPDGYSWHTVKLTFVKENGAWKLDGPSY